jgi:hypothetical protein
MDFFFPMLTRSLIPAWGPIQFWHYTLTARVRSHRLEAQPYPQCDFHFRYQLLV